MQKIDTMEFGKGIINANDQRSSNEVHEGNEGRAKRTRQN